MNNWQPIETAPKDGTRIILTDGEEMEICSWGSPYPVDFPEKKAWIFGRGDDYSNYNQFFFPTHWMPCPEIP